MAGHVLTTTISGVYDLTRISYPDTRGFFREVFHQDELEKFLGHPFVPLQMNHSCSFPKVIRGLHAEHWNKLVYPVSGEVFTALADIRPDSETFGQVLTFTFGDNHRHALYIPQGVANSVCVIGSVPSDYIYLVDAYYTGTDTTAIAWNDPDLNITWPIPDPIVSARDQQNPRLRDLFPEKFKSP